MISVTILEYILTFWCKHFLAKVADIFDNFLGYFEKYCFLSKTPLATYLTFEKLLPLVFFKIFCPTNIDVSYLHSYIQIYKLVGIFYLKHQYYLDRIIAHSLDKNRQCLTYIRHTLE